MLFKSVNIKLTYYYLFNATLAYENPSFFQKIKFSFRGQ